MTSGGRRLSREEIIERNLPPGERLALLADRQGETLASLSRLIKRGDGYLSNFVARGVPKQLRPDDIDILARYLGVTPSEFGG